MGGLGMIGPILHWLLLAISLFNTSLTLWLGLTVLLNAERRTPGVWLTASGLLLGCAFFVSHTILLSGVLAQVDLIGSALDVWWRFGWVPVLALPFVWCAVILWYTGFGPDSPAHHRWGLGAAVTLAAVLVALLFFANPLPSFTPVAQLILSPALSIGGVPLLIWLYPVYSLLCIGLSIDALLRPGPTARLMGDLARRRARPYLIATGAAFFFVTVFVAAAMLLIARLAGTRRADLTALIEWFDLAISALIAFAALLVGRAVVSYEVFTGQALPRQGFLRHWRNAALLAAGYSALVSAGLTLRLSPIYSLLIATGLIAAFYALLSWRSYAERERAIHQLRPFVASQQLYDHLLGSPSVDVSAPFTALCKDVLGTTFARLEAVGPVVALTGPALVYPVGASQAPLPGLPSQPSSPQTMCLPLDPAQHAGAQWAVPLWSERGFMGWLLLGEKTDGGLYTQEEIEVARAGGERLIDTQATAELARRLMTLQRRHLAESQLLDRRARRVLHDDILPQLHAASLHLNARNTAEATSALADAHHQISDLLRDLPPAAAPALARDGLVAALRQMAADEFAGAFDAVEWAVSPAAEAQARALPAFTAEALFYAAREAVRNAARHGRDAARPLHLRIGVTAGEGFEMAIEDDGVGVEHVPQGDGGSGLGLLLHGTLMAVVGGSLAVQSSPGRTTRVILSLPRAAAP